MTSKQERMDDAAEDAAQDRADARAAHRATLAANAAIAATPIADPPHVAPGIGSLVHHVNPSGECQAALVTGHTADPDRVHLVVFPVGSGGAAWRDLPFHADKGPHTWHRPC